MSELKTRPTDASVEEFLALQAGARRADCEAIGGMMEAATGERAQMWGSPIDGFARYLYPNSTNKPQEWPLVGFSPRKHDLTLYIMPGFDGFAGLRARLGRHKVGKSCLYLKRLADVDAAVLQQLIEGSVRAMEARRVRA